MVDKKIAYKPTSPKILIDFNFSTPLKVDFRFYIANQVFKIVGQTHLLTFSDDESINYDYMTRSYTRVKLDIYKR